MESDREWAREKNDEQIFDQMMHAFTADNVPIDNQKFEICIFSWKIFPVYFSVFAEWKSNN